MAIALNANNPFMDLMMRCLLGERLGPGVDPFLLNFVVASAESRFVALDSFAGLSGRNQICKRRAVVRRPVEEVHASF